jgi:2,5-dihydroxypyridine 5,6-dioxygenase
VPKVRIPTPLRKLTDGEGQVTADGGDLRDVIASLEASHPGIGERLLDDSGQLRRFVNVFVRDEDVRFQEGLDTKVGDDDIVSIVPAVAGGGRGLMLTQWRDDMLIRGGIEADFPAIAPICRGLAAVFEQGATLRVTAPGGTDLTMDIRGRRGNALTCMVQPGDFSPVPTVEANVSPVEGTANGRIVADVSVPYADIGVLAEPIVAEVRDGRIATIDGGAQARRLQEVLDGFGDPLVYNIAEYGMGLNPLARVTGCMLEDEAVAGTAHIGIGTSITLGGTVKAACHYDLLLWHPTVEVDGRIVARDGRLEPEP